MANQWEATLKDAIKKLADAVADATQLEVTTQFVEPDANGLVVTKTTASGKQQTTPGKAVVSAYTRMNRIDADYSDIVPVKKMPDGSYQVASEIHDIHKANVADARDYVADLVSSVMQAIQSL